MYLAGYLAIFLCLVVGFRLRFHTVWSRPLCNCLVKKINQGTDVLTHNCLPPPLALCVLKHVCTRLIILTSNHKIKIDVASWQSAVATHSPLRLQIPFLTHGSSIGRFVSHCYRSDGCYGEPNIHCPPRAVQCCCCCYAASFPPYTASEWSYHRWTTLHSRTSVQNGRACRSVCFSFNRTCAFLKLLRRYLMNKVIYFIGRQSTHCYHLIVWIIINTKV